MSPNSTIRTNFTQINSANDNINSSVAGQGNTGVSQNGIGTQQGLLAGRRRRAGERRLCLGCVQPTRGLVPALSRRAGTLCAR